MAHEQPPRLFPGDGSEPDDDDDDDIDSTFGDDDKSTTTIDPEELHMTCIYGREYTSAYKGACSCTPTDGKYQEVMWSKYRSATEEPGWRLHLAPLKGNIQRVLDIGTGIGSWAIQFAETHPSSTVIGTDIAPIQPLRVPPNVQFELDDCNRDWTWSPGSFDYVRICNMTGNVKDWPRLFRMARRCTRIGGFIESSEDSILFGTTMSQNPLPRTLQVWNLGVILAGVCSGRSFNVVEYDQQVQSMVEAGIEIRRTEHSWISYSERLLHNLLDDLDGVFNFPAKQLGWSPEGVTVFLSDVRKAIRSHRRWLCFRRTVVVGKVPQYPQP